MIIVPISEKFGGIVMIVSPLLNGSTRHHDADIVLVEGEIDGHSGEERMLIAPFHIHHSDEEIFYLLSGQIGFIVGDDEFIASAGDAVVVPPGAVHTWWAASKEPARYLIAMSKRMDDLIIALHTGSFSPDEMPQVFADHDSTLIGWTR